MTLDIALFLVTVVVVMLAATRILRRDRPAQAPVQVPVIAERPRPRHFALPPVTIETMWQPNMVPPIDHGMFAALLASGSRGDAVPQPKRVARGSVATRSVSESDLDTQTLMRSDVDGALRAATDIDDDAETHTNMSPVR